jgi:hypothetical protein
MWRAFETVTKNDLGNLKAGKCELPVEEFPSLYKLVRVRMSLYYFYLSSIPFSTKLHYC